MKKKVLATLMAGILAVGLVACGSSSSSDTSEEVSEEISEEAAEEENAEDSTEEETEEISAEEESEETEEVEEASEEEETELSGKVTVYMPSPSGLADKIAEGFTAATGVEVEVFQGTTGEILARLEAEEANPVADVVILASWSDGLSLKEEGQLVSYTPENADLIVDGWIDEDSMLFGYSASAVGVIYNTTIIESLDADWDEFTSEEYADLLAIPDPEKSGSCKDFLAGFVNAYGWDTIEGMAANGMTVPGANKAALESVTTGEVGILIAGVDYNAYSSIASGEPLALYYPESGTVVNPRPAMILNTAPNMDNAKAFIDYLFSDEAQEMVAEAYLLPGRSDITCDNRLNLDEIPQIELDWEAMMDISTDAAAKLLDLCGATE